MAQRKLHDSANTLVDMAKVCRPIAYFMSLNVIRIESYLHEFHKAIRPCWTDWNFFHEAFNQKF